jgi:hypothetical protein
MTTLTDDDRAALDLEARFWKHAGTKEDAIRRELGTTPTRHYQRVVRLLQVPAAWEHAPAAMGRFDRTLRAGRRRGHAGE